MDPERAWRAIQRRNAFTCAKWGLTYVICFGLAIWQLTSAERSGLDDAWQAVWWILAVAALACLIWLVTASMWVVHLRLHSSVAALRQTALAADPAMAHLAADQPVPLAGDDLPHGSETCGPFAPPEVHRPAQPNRDGLGIFIVSLNVVLQSLLLAMGVYNPSLAWIGAHPALVAALGALAVVCLVTFAAAAVQRLAQARQHAAQRQRGIRLTADAIELRSEPIPGYSAISIPWHEARAFYTTLPPVSPNIMLGTAFCLDAGTRALTWWLTPSASPEERAAHDRLCRLIVTRTSLPLRDVTRAAWDIARPITGRWRRLGPRRWGVIAFVLAPLVAVFILALVALDMRIYQVQDFITLVPVIERQSPQFRDPLTAPDGYWPVHPASATQGAFSFSEGAYQITGGPQDQALEALTQHPYGDVAIEVTARQRRGSSFDGVGLVLRENAAHTNEITFTISPDGTWTLTRYQANPPSGASNCTYPYLATHSGAIHTGTDEPNTLFVLMRGATYFLFVNGQYLGSYVDTTQHPLTSGYTGLFLADPTTIGLFSNFAVFRAP